MVDAAQELEQRDREAALGRLRIAQSHAPRDARVDDLCIDCDEPIEPKRLLALESTARCASCARDFEQRHGRGVR